MLKVYSKVILGYIVWIKEGKLLNPKIFFTIVNIPPPKTPKDNPNFQWYGPILPLFYLGFCIHHGPN
jgi:hypothetical protein